MGFLQVDAGGCQSCHSCTQAQQRCTVFSHRSAVSLEVQHLIPMSLFHGGGSREPLNPSLSLSHMLSVSFLRQLMENKINAIERGAFQDLKELERL